MKRLNSRTMKIHLKFAIKKAKQVLKYQKVKEGTLIPLGYKTVKNGNYYQYDLIKDSRVCKNMYVVVYSFKRPHTQFCRDADYYLLKEIC